MLLQYIFKYAVWTKIWHTCEFSHWTELQTCIGVEWDNIMVYSSLGPYLAAYPLTPIQTLALSWIWSPFIFIIAVKILLTKSKNIIGLKQIRAQTFSVNTSLMIEQTVMLFFSFPCEHMLKCSWSSHYIWMKCWFCSSVSLMVNIVCYKILEYSTPSLHSVG